MAKVPDCDLVVNVFERQSPYYFPFRTLGKVMNFLILSAMGYKSLLSFFYKDSFDID